MAAVANPLKEVLGTRSGNEMKRIALGRVMVLLSIIIINCLVKGGVKVRIWMER